MIIVVLIHQEILHQVVIIIIIIVLLLPQVQIAVQIFCLIPNMLLNMEFLVNYGYQFDGKTMVDFSLRVEKDSPLRDQMKMKEVKV